MMRLLALVALVLAACESDQTVPLVQFPPAPTINDAETREATVADVLPRYDMAVDAGAGTEDAGSLDCPADMGCAAAGDEPVGEVVLWEQTGDVNTVGGHGRFLLQGRLGHAIPPSQTVDPCTLHLNCPGCAEEGSPADIGALSVEGGLASTVQVEAAEDNAYTFAEATDLWAPSTSVRVTAVGGGFLAGFDVALMSPPGFLDVTPPAGATLTKAAPVTVAWATDGVGGELDAVEVELHGEGSDRRVRCIAEASAQELTIPLAALLWLTESSATMTITWRTSAQTAFADAPDSVVDVTLEQRHVVGTVQIED